MNKLLVLLLVCTTSPCWAEKIDLYVMAGQSNMFGVVPVSDLPNDLQEPQDVPFKFSMQYLPGVNFYSDGFIDLQPLSNFSPQYFLSTFASELSFGQTMSEQRTSRFAILKVCGNGTSLANDWNPANPTSLYHRLVGATSEAVAELTDLGYQPSVSGLIWVQGEEDSQNQLLANAYATNLENFLDQLRSETWFSTDIPIVINQLHSNTQFPYVAAVRNAQAATVAARTDNVHLLNNDDLVLYSDRVHYTNAMQIEVGRRLTAFFPSPVPEPAGVQSLVAVLAVAVLSARRKRSCVDQLGRARLRGMQALVVVALA